MGHLNQIAETSSMLATNTCHVFVMGVEIILKTTHQMQAEEKQEGPGSVDCEGLWGSEGVVAGIYCIASSADRQEKSFLL